MIAARNPSADVQPRDRLLGQVLHGARLEAVLGEGSASRVYRARHLVLEREYAVKVLSVPHAHKDDLVERFYREARALSRMAHENIVGVVDCGQTHDGRPFLTMEMLFGETLQARLERGRLAMNEVVDITRQVLSGLAEAHRRGLVHRDLKPANVMLVNVEGATVAKLLDFGVARLVRDDQPQITSTEMLLGTPRYMAPEQAMRAADASPRSDLYSFGVMLYEMLAGRAPFEGGLIEVLDKQFHTPPPVLRTSSGLEPLVFQLLEKDPAKRPSNALLVLAELERLLRMPRTPSLSFPDRTRRSQLPELDLDGPTLLDEPLPFDGQEDTVPSGNEPTVLRARVPAVGATNLRIYDDEHDTREMSPADPTTDFDTDPDDAPLFGERTMSELVSSSNPLMLMVLAMVLAFSVTMVAGTAVQHRIADFVATR
ncbi:MAG: serine/threonine-protein kinase [Deltaproteobacteria bacterium]|jgi:serine/threonine protein kinase